MFDPWGASAPVSDSLLRVVTVNSTPSFDLVYIYFLMFMCTRNLNDFIYTVIAMLKTIHLREITAVFL